MNEIKILINKSPEFIKKIEKSISNAVGDDIILDKKINEFDTGNGTPNRIWDFINRNIGKNLSKEDYITGVTKRGRWEIKPIFEKETGILYTLMREERLIELKREVTKRNSLHYAQALADALNKDLIPCQEQLSIFEQQNYYDQDQILQIVHKIFEDLSIPGGIVKHHALILFSSSNYELVSLRCCVVKSDLNVVAEADWNNFIQINESTIMEQVSSQESNYTNLTNGLKFKQKAKDKIGQKKLNSIKSKTEKDITDVE